jgi:flagella basal body P-ring formation protein FlgA
MIPLAAFALSACLALPPAADHIRARDLAAAIPAWSAVDADTDLLPAPIPGVQRVLHADELRRLAARWNVQWSGLPSPLDVCFSIPVVVPDPSHMLAAMQRSLPNARIEILETSRQPAPEGEFEFPPSALHSGLWTGSVTYGRTHKFAVWARVKAVVTVTRVVAAQEIKMGQPLDAAQLRVETQDASPASVTLLTAIADAAGRVPRRTIPAGAAIRPEWLDTPKEIQRGDTVQVDVIQGAAHLRLQGVAQTAGAIGDTIYIENPASKRRFPARVEAKGKALVKGTL